MHRITLEIHDGTSAARRYWIQNNFVVHVGSSDLMDVSIPHDPGMAGQHFAIYANGNSCAIADLESGLPTLVNGRKAYHQELRDGDHIQAGSAQFFLRMTKSEFDTPANAHSAPCANVASDQRLEVDVDELDSGVCIYRPADVQGFPLQDILERLVSKFSAYLVVNKQQLGWACDQTFPELVSQPEVRPHLAFAASDDVKFHVDLMERTRARDATTCILSKAPYEELAKTLGEVASSFITPSVLTTQFSAAPRPFIDRVLDQKDAVLVAQPDGQWELYAVGDANAGWQDLGLPQPPRNLDLADHTAPA